MTGRSVAQGMTASAPSLGVLFLLVTILSQLGGAETPAEVAVDLAPGPIWPRHTIDSGSRGADGVKLGDFNRDGLPDIATGWEEGGEVRIYLNPGPPNAHRQWPRTTVALVKNVEDAIFTDLDGNGDLEVVSCTEGRTRTIYLHQPSANGEWATAPFPCASGNRMWMQAAAMNVDGVNGIDLIVGSKDKGAAVGWFKSPEAFAGVEGWSYRELRQAGWIMSLLPNDMDGDGDQDILFTDRKGGRGGIFWLENPGADAVLQDAEWREHLVGAAGREVLFADLADLNKDGRPDVAAALKPHSAVICLRRPDGGWDEQTLRLDATLIGDAKAVKAGDFNGDALMDLAFTCEGAKGSLQGIVLLERRSDGGWLQKPLGGPDGVKFDLMQTLDIDGDGDLDILTCEERDQLGVIWYENPHG